MIPVTESSIITYDYCEPCEEVTEHVQGICQICYTDECIRQIRNDIEADEAQEYYD